VDNAPYGTVFINIFKEVFNGTKYEWGIIGNEKDIPALLYPLRPRQSRFSKYVLTCGQLGLITGVDAPFI